MASGGRGVRGASFAAALGAVALVASTSPLVLATTSCAGSDCAADTQSYGSCTQGYAVDANTWASTAIVGEPWLDFHGERTWIFDPTPWFGSRTPGEVSVNLSFTPLPNSDGGDGAAPAAGNLGEWKLVQTANGWQVYVTNDTCAQYYVYVVVTYPALPEGETLHSMCAADGGT
jgi:hypothetical protein